MSFEFEFHGLNVYRRLSELRKNEYKPHRKIFFLWLAYNVSKRILFIYVIYIYSIYILIFRCPYGRKQKMKRGKWQHGILTSVNGKATGQSPSQQWQEKVWTQEMMLPLTAQALKSHPFSAIHVVLFELNQCFIEGETSASINWLFLTYYLLSKREVFLEVVKYLAHVHKLSSCLTGTLCTSQLIDFQLKGWELVENQKNASFFSAKFKAHPDYKLL